MEGEILANLRGLTWQAAVIAILVFGFTMLLKWPIKKATAKLDEKKRKAINTVIVFIPMQLSFLFSLLYFGIVDKQWCNLAAIDTSISAYILAVGIYAFYSRVIILFKGVKKENSQDLSKEAVKIVKNNIKSISKALKVDEKSLNELAEKIDGLLSLREKLLQNNTIQDLPATENIDKQLEELSSQKLKLITEIEINKSQLDSLKSLNK